MLGDVISAIDDLPIHSRNDLMLAFEKYKIGQRVKLTVMRNGTSLKIDAELEATE